jgi:hypothetical protein
LGFEYYLFKARIETKKMLKAIKKERTRVVQIKLKTPNPKSFWSVINNLVGKRTFNDNIELDVNNTTVSDPAQVSELFVQFFQNKVLSLSKTLPTTTSRPTLMNFDHLMFTADDIKKAIKSTKSKHCYGFNGIPLRIAKDFCELKPECAIYYLNRIAREGLTKDQRTARILPLHKKGSKKEISNFRTIANLYSLSKVYEKLLYQRLLTETEGLEGLCQHGFRRHHSTTTALLQLQHLISKHLEDGYKCLVYSVDLSAAFDVLVQ